MLVDAVDDLAHERVQQRARLVIPLQSMHLHRDGEDERSGGMKNVLVVLCELNELEEAGSG